MSDAGHWDAVYAARETDRLTWFEAGGGLSLDWIAGLARPGDPILDVGAGASRLVDGLLAAGLGPVTLLDLSDRGLAVTRARLGPAAAAVRFVTADLRRWTPDRSFAVWHDRAVFHFLTDPADRAAYVGAMAAALPPGGHAIVAGFAADGPETCSGLPVMRYGPEALAAEIDARAPGGFAALRHARHDHVTPAGRVQTFRYSLLRRT